MANRNSKSPEEQSQRIDVALATCSKVPNLAPDDRLLLIALHKRGLTAAPVVWDVQDFDWSRVRLCVLRSTWDYSTRREAFLSWAESVAAVTQLWNPIEIVRWNTHKSYLRSLAERGVRVVPTVWLDAGSRTNLAELMSARGWTDAVVKPAVSASARNTIRVSTHSSTAAQAHLDRLLAVEDAMVQPFLSAVESEGELSVIFIEDEFSHAVSKRPSAGDYRVQDDFGGRDACVAPTHAELRFAEQTLRAARYDTLYARVDIIRGEDNALYLVELELVEPSLFLNHSPESVRRLANSIRARLRNSPPEGPRRESSRFR